MNTDLISLDLVINKKFTMINFNCYFRGENRILIKWLPAFLALINCFKNP